MIRNLKFSPFCPNNTQRLLRYAQVGSYLTKRGTQQYSRIHFYHSIVTLLGSLKLQRFKFYNKYIEHIDGCIKKHLLQCRHLQQHRRQLLVTYRPDNGIFQRLPSVGF